METNEEGGVGLSDENAHENESVARPKVVGGAFDWRLYNVVILGVCFMLIFSAFQTASMAAVRSACVKWKGGGAPV